MSLISRSVFLASLFLLSAQTVSAQILVLGIDIDDTTLNMITEIYLRSMDDGSEISVDTHAFGSERPQIGRSGPFARYTIDYDDHTGSYRAFRDYGINHPQESAFVKDLFKAIQVQGKVPKGPLFHLLQLVMSEPSLLPWAKMITTRGHLRSSIRHGFEVIRDLGELQNAPLLENIYPVTSQELGGNSPYISERKIAVLLDDLEKVKILKVSGNGILLRSPDGSSRGRYHVMEFWDDDLKTAPIAKENLGAWVRSNPGVPVKIIVRRPHRGGVEHSVFLSTGETRPMLPDEHDELPRLVEHFRKLRLASRPLRCLEILTRRQGLPVESLRTDPSLLRKVR